MKQSEEMKRINEEFKKSPAYAEMMKYAWIEKDVKKHIFMFLYANWPFLDNFPINYI